MDPYTTFKFKNIRGICLEEFRPRIEETITGWSRWMDDPENRIYMKRPNRIVGMPLPEPLLSAAIEPETQIVAKEFGWRNPFHQILSPLTQSRALRSFRVASHLRRNGVSTPRPLAAWENRRFGFVSTCVFIYREIPNAVLIRQLIKDHPARDEVLSSALKDLAKLVRGMHDAGVFHRDLTLGNFLAVPSASGSEESHVSVIDLSRAVLLPSVPVFLRLMDLARMKLLHHWDFFYNLYCYERTDWKDYQPRLERMIWLRRKKVDFGKGLKKIFGK